MSGLAGIVAWGHAPASTQLFPRMTEALAYWGPDGVHTHQDHHAAFAYFHAATTPEAAFERQPRLLANGEWMVAAARLDYRDELADALHIEHAQRPTLADGDLIARAYLQWGQACVDHLMGDWSMAVYNPATQQLFAARDQFGNTGLYYHANPHYFAFASGRKALLALGQELHVLDDLYLAQLLLSWPVYYGERTVYRHIQRLPPAHSLTATAQGVQPRRYWQLEDVTPLPLRTVEDAAEGFREVFDRAVATRLRTNGPLGVTLSGGLDSGSVAATAAPLLAAQGRPFTAYTSVPLTDQLPATEHNFGDEWNFAAATAASAGIYAHHAVNAAAITPLLGLIAGLWTHDEPQHAAANAFWLTSLMQTAAQDGLKALLTGQGGNGTISWTGAPPHPKPHTVRGQLRAAFLKVVPQPFTAQFRIWRTQLKDDWYGHTSVNPAWVHRIHALSESVKDPRHPLRMLGVDEQQERLMLIGPGRSLLGALWHEISAAYGVEVRDPTMDTRLIRYCLAVPQHLYYDPATDTDRWLIRQAMHGRLPDVVRLNRKRGFQAADVTNRLRADAANVTQTLDDLARGPAAAYLDLAKLRQAWGNIQARIDRQTHRDATVVLLRGLMAGLFLQQSHDPRPRPTLPLPAPHTIPSQVEVRA